MKKKSVEEIVIRDLREKSHFVVDDQYLNGYAKILKPFGTAVYISLCRHADFHTQRCWPSQETIAEQHGISVRQVRREIKNLELLNIIKVDQIRSDKGKITNNEYSLLDKSQWSMVKDSYVPKVTPGVLGVRIIGGHHEEAKKVLFNRGK